jgi:hypothetical protein
MPRVRAVSSKETNIKTNRTDQKAKSPYFKRNGDGATSGGDDDLVQDGMAPQHPFEEACGSC